MSTTGPTTWCCAGALLITTLCVRAAPVDSTETMRMRAYIQGVDEAQGSTEITIRRTAGQVHLTEERQTSKGEQQRYDVTFAGDTLRPVAWTRTSTSGTTTSVTQLLIVGDQLKASTRTGSGPATTSALRIPGEPWCVAPLMKFFAARCVASGTDKTVLHHVNVPPDGELKVTDVDIADLGIERVATPAGEFQCHRIRFSPRSVMMSALVPPAELFIGTDSTHPLVKMVLSPTRVSSPIVTELEEYQLEPHTAGDAP